MVVAQAEILSNDTATLPPNLLHGSWLYDCWSKQVVGHTDMCSGQHKSDVHTCTCPLTISQIYIYPMSINIKWQIFSPNGSEYVRTQLPPLSGQITEVSNSWKMLINFYYILHSFIPLMAKTLISTSFSKIWVITFTWWCWCSVTSLHSGRWSKFSSFILYFKCLIQVTLWTGYLCLCKRICQWSLCK